MCSYFGSIGFLNKINKIMHKLEFYTDGSHLKGTDKVTYGICLVDGQAVSTHSGELNTKEFKNKYNSDVSNPTAEFYAAAVVTGLIRDIPNLEVTVYSDFNGVQKWISRGWKAKKPYIKDLLSFIDKNLDTFAKNGSTIEFVWVKGHSGNKFNEMADQLCRKPAHCEIAPYLQRHVTKQKVLQWSFKAH